MSGQIFISYLREESRWSAGRLYDRLCARFDRKQIFMDIDAIAPGDDFIKTIEKTVGECDVLIAVIGAHWLTSKGEQDSRRIDNPEDFVRREIATALKREIRVIPVLVDGAFMPLSAELPDDLKPLVRRMALQVSDTGFDDDCRRLVAAIEQALEKTLVEPRERDKRERLEVQEPERKQPGRTLTLEHPRLRLLTRLSFVSFVLVLLSYRLPFFEELGSPLLFGYEYVWDLVVYLSHPIPVEGRILLNDVVLFSAFLCPIFVLSSHFLKYRWKAVLEVVVSWICFVLLATSILNPLELEPPPYARNGVYLACTFAAAGAVMKTVLLFSNWGSDGFILFF